MARQNRQMPDLAAVLFDFGGVLAEEGFREGLKALARRFGLDPQELYLLGSELVYESGYALGQGSESEFWSLLATRSGLPPYVPAFTEEILRRFVLRPEMIEAVRRLRRHGLRAVILSDQTDWLDRLERRDRFFAEFDAVFNSYHLGQSKRDGGIFPRIVRQMGIPEERALFLDDNEGNVARARRKGLRAMLFQDPTAGLRDLEALTGIPLRT